ncbi:MAG: hypothetical protein IJ991_09300 [Thermoguttaceae bacterium]|nr:hypothetical protein [Thermoguttaceae bacterium]
MNLKNVGSVALLLAAVVCFAFGVGKSRLLTLESVAAEAEVSQTEEPNQAGVADVAKEATTRSFFESLGTWAAGIVIAAIMGIIGFFRKKIFGIWKREKLSDLERNLLRALATPGEKVVIRRLKTIGFDEYSCNRFQLPQDTPEQKDALEQALDRLTALGYAEHTATSRIDDEWTASFQEREKAKRKGAPPTDFPRI